MYDVVVDCYGKLEDELMLTGHVENGVVVLDLPSALADGTLVNVEPIAPHTGTPRRSLLERLGDVVGKVEGLPPDASQNVDRYLYGEAKP